LSSAIGAAGNAVQVGLLRASAWTARGLRVPARNALLADAVPPHAYGCAYGFERAMDNLGAIAGPLLARALVNLVGVRTAILVSMIPGLLAAAAIVYAIRHIPRHRDARRTRLRLRVRPVLASRRLAPGVGLFELGNIAATMLILRATELLTPTRGADAATSAALTLYLTYNVATTATSLCGRLTRPNTPAPTAPAPNKPAAMRAWSRHRLRHRSSRKSKGTGMGSTRSLAS
jgi:MFS family permease